MEGMEVMGLINGTNWFFFWIIVNDLYIMHANYMHSTMAQSHIKIAIPTLRLTHLPPNPKIQVIKWKGKQKERRTSMTFHFQLNNRVPIVWPYLQCLSCTHCKTVVGPYTNCKCMREDHSTPWNWRWKKKNIQFWNNWRGAWCQKNWAT